MGRHIVRDLRTALLVADKNGKVSKFTLDKPTPKRSAKKAPKPLPKKPSKPKKRAEIVKPASNMITLKPCKVILTRLTAEEIGKQTAQRGGNMNLV